jgi:hypothetical protein
VSPVVCLCAVEFGLGVCRGTPQVSIRSGVSRSIRSQVDRSAAGSLIGGFAGVGFLSPISAFLFERMLFHSPGRYGLGASSRLVRASR